MTHYLLGQVDDRQPASLKLSRGWIYSLVMAIALAVAYFLAARLSLSFSPSLAASLFFGRPRAFLLAR